jgi:hypothetical protein
LFNLKKLTKVDGQVHYPIEIPNGFGALENLDVEVDINSAWETVRISEFQPMRL